MKKIIVLGSFLTLLGTPVLADWAEDFMATFAGKGVDPAVEEAFKAGVAPLDILTMTQQTGGVESAAVVKALYCAGVSGTTVLAVASEAGVSSSDVAAGYKQSIGQCGPAAALNPDPFSNTQNIAAKGSPVGERIGSPGTPPGGNGQPPVILPPVDGGGNTRPPSVSPDHPN